LPKEQVGIDFCRIDKIRIISRLIVVLGSIPIVLLLSTLLGSSVPLEMVAHRGPAKVFQSDEAALEALNRGVIQPKDTIIIPYAGPKGGPGMLVVYKTAFRMVELELHTTVALVVGETLFCFKDGIAEAFGHCYAFGAPDNNSFQVLGAHDSPNTGTAGCPSCIVHDVGHENTIFTSRADAGHFGLCVRLL